MSQATKARPAQSRRPFPRLPALRQDADLLELFFAQSLDGFFFMMLDEPVRWDDTVNKEEVLDYVFAHQRMTKVNEAMLAQYGAAEAQFLGLTPNDFYAHDLPYGRRIWRAFFDAGHLHLETDERRLDGTPIWIEGDYLCFYDQDGRITGHFGIQRDITARKRAEEALRQANRRLKTLQEIDHAILAAHSPQEIAAAAMRHMHDLIPCVRASVAVFDQSAGEATLIAIRTTAPTQMGVGTRLPLAAFGDIAALAAGRPRVVRDVNEVAPDPGGLGVRHEGVRSYLNVPLLAQGELIGVLNVGVDQPHALQAEHVEIAQEVATNLAVALSQARLLEHIARHAAELEARVAERTAELSALNASLQQEIENRKRAEVMLRKNEERYRILYHQTPIMLHSLDKHARLVSVNQHWLNVMGYTREEVLGRPVAEFQTEQSARFAIDYHFREQFLQTGKAENLELQFLKKDGGLIEVLLSAEGTFDEQGELIFTQSFLVDITARKQAERALHERLAIEKMIGDISTHFINLDEAEIEAGIDYALRRLGEFEGVDRSYLFLLFEEGRRARNTHEWCAPGVSPQIHHLQNLAFDQLPWVARRILSRETLFVPRVASLPVAAEAEKLHWQEQGIQSLLNVPLVLGGKVMGFLGFDSVRAEKAWAEEDVRRLSIVSEIIANSLHRRAAAAALRASEARVMRIFESAMDAIITIDSRMQVVMCNEAAEKVFRCQSAEMKGQRLEGFLSEGFLALLHNYMQAPASARPQKYLWAPAGLTALRQDGEAFPVEATISRVEGGQQDLFTIILRDINERKQAEEALAQLQNQNLYLREEQQRREYNFGDIIGGSPAMRQVYQSIEMVAATGTTVMLLGETGTGKELIARAIHQRSSRKEQFMVTVNCGALPAGLVESELFGHEKGAFTGATAQKKGRFELAHKSTLFLDEIGELPLETQVKLLRVLQEQTFERVGGTQTLQVNVRVIAATNRDLQEEVQRGAFRADLFYRLNIFPIPIPPLRERRDDIPLLADYFLQQFARRLSKRIAGLSPAAAERLSRYDWPGNVRELANIIERAVILCQGRVLQEEHLGLAGPARAGGENFATLEEAERRHILQALEKSGGVLAGPKGAAQLLGINRSTLWSRMRKLGINTSRSE